MVSRWSLATTTPPILTLCLKIGFINVPHTRSGRCSIRTTISRCWSPGMSPTWSLPLCGEERLLCGLSRLTGSAWCHNSSQELLPKEISCGEEPIQAIWLRWRGDWWGTVWVWWKKCKGSPQTSHVTGPPHRSTRNLTSPQPMPNTSWPKTAPDSSWVKMTACGGRITLKSKLKLNCRFLNPNKTELLVIYKLCLLKKFH